MGARESDVQILLPLFDNGGKPFTSSRLEVCDRTMMKRMAALNFTRLPRNLTARPDASCMAFLRCRRCPVNCWKAPHQTPKKVNANHK